MTILRARRSVPDDFISRNLPAGHDTVWGWAAKFLPGELPAKLDPEKAFAYETRQLLAQSAAEGLKVIAVEAPAALRALGAETIPAFDTQLLFMMSRS
jgi:hypothetical protein